MTAKNNDKPYKVYHAGHVSRRRSGDADLAKLRQEEQSPAAEAGQSAGTGRATSRRRAAGRKAAASDPGRTRRRRFRWWFIPLGLFLALLIGMAGVSYWAYPKYKVFDRAVKKANKRVSERTREALTPDRGSLLSSPTTILIIGADTRPTDIGRADTIMLVRVDPKKRTITQLSIPRDMRVDIPGYGTGKINASYSVRALTENKPSPDITIKTVEQFTGVPINHVMLVDFTGLFRMVNAVGGIDVKVPETVTYGNAPGATPSKNVITFEKGLQHFDGLDALHYSRIRYVNGISSDADRMARQQLVVQALEKKTMQPRNFGKLGEIGRRFMTGVSTDLTTRQILELAYRKWRTPPGNNVKLVMTFTGEVVGGEYFAVSDQAANAKLLRRFLGN